jgi:predicted ester cyclase
MLSPIFAKLSWKVVSLSLLFSHSLLVMGDTGSIACRWTFTGTFKKAYQGYQPNNHKISWQGVSVYHVENGMITSVRSIFDSKPFYAALSQPQEGAAEGGHQ